MISIIIPTKNEEKNLPQLLKSLKNQNYSKKFEILVVDGKSKDRTREIAREFGCRVIVQKKLGISNARNLGWKNAKGNILVFLEADHVVNKNFLREIEKAFKEEKVYCARPLVIPLKTNWIQKALAVQIELATRRYKAWEFPTIFKKEVFRQVKGWDESIDFAEDREFGMRLVKLGYKAKLIKKAIVYAKPVDSLTKLFKQGRWYGRGIFAYVKKTGDWKLMVGMLIYSSFFPLLLLSVFSRIFLFLFLINLSILFGYSFKGFLITKSPYSFLIVPVNLVRGLGELVGMIESFFIKSKGRL